MARYAYVLRTLSTLISRLLNTTLRYTDPRRGNTPLRRAQGTGQSILTSPLLTTFNSLFSRYRFRLPFRLNLSKDVFQERMDRILEYCPGTIVIADDVGVLGKDEQQRDENLRHLMRTRHGFVFNQSKCSIKIDSLTFFGLHFDKDCVHPDPERMKSIQQMTSPDSPQALREFLGIVTYMRSCTKDLGPVVPIK